VLVISIVISTISVIAIALIAVGGAVKKTSEMPDQVVFEASEAIEFCAQALPDSTTSQLSYENLEKILRIHLEWIQAFHWSPEKFSPSALVFDQAEPLQYLAERTDIVGLDVTAEEIKVVLDAHYEYLIAIGALDTPTKEHSILDLSEAPALLEE